MVIRNRLVARLWVARFGNNAARNQVQTHPLQSTRAELQCLRRSIRQIDDPARHDRSAVIDPDDDRLAIPQIRHLDIASERNPQVRCGHVVHVVLLAAGCFLTLKVSAVPGRCPNLIRFGLAGLFADFWSYLNRTNWSRFRLRDVRSLSRSQADDQTSDRQSMSYTSSHSVLLAYSKVPLA